MSLTLSDNDVEALAAALGEAQKARLQADRAYACLRRKLAQFEELLTSIRPETPEN
ncbi:hypothetical protein [Tardiphaga alba]|uniref:hypothetical protein n=1 Tax=Tardiphaga alba TaxID=340268 RepID=UPI001BACA3AE|nr:hypothetical protein [Tardiphaga alba]